MSGEHSIRISIFPASNGGWKVIIHWGDRREQFSSFRLDNAVAEAISFLGEFRRSYD